MKLLVVDAYAPDGRAGLRDAGATEAGQLYAGLLRRLAAPGDAEIEIAYPADPTPKRPDTVALEGYDGAVWTGSSLTIADTDAPSVHHQIELARELITAGVPSFGSCWAAQLAVVAAGGRCAPNPRGREFGISRRIALSEAGRAHPLYAGKPDVFDAFTSHADEICALPGTATLLASNAFSRVQAVAVHGARANFWAVQYHPEYDAREVAALCRLRAGELIAQGTFTDRDAADRFSNDMDAIGADPARADVAAEHGLGTDLLDENSRTREVANWLSTQVAPRAKQRSGELNEAGV